MTFAAQADGNPCNQVTGTPGDGDSCQETAEEGRRSWEVQAQRWAAFVTLYVKELAMFGFSGGPSPVWR